jgi:monovalent cation:H+ antiporter-2, CPA2 family
LNFAPGFLAGLLLGLGPTLAIVLGGVTYVSSSGIVAKVLADQGWTGNRETPVVLSVLVIEDLVMALYLPIVLAAASRIEVGVSKLVFSRSDESLLLTILGVTVLIAGAAELFGLSAAVAALLLGIVLSGPAAEAAHGLLSPLRDLFAALFFAFVGLSVDPASIPPVLLPAALLALLTVFTKFATGWIGARRAGVGTRGRIRAGAILTARGEFSIAIAGLATAAGVAADFEALAISYVFVLAIVGPILARFADKRTFDRSASQSTGF